MPSSGTKVRGGVLLKTVLAVVGAVVSVFLIATAFFTLDPATHHLVPRFSVTEFIHDIPANARWLLPFALLTAAMAPLRALQWQRTLKHHVPFAERYHLVAIAGIANNLLPGKVGDGIRAFLMSRSQNVPFVNSFGSVMVCKLLEFAALMALAGLSFAGPFASAMRSYSGALEPALALCAGLVLVVVLLAHYSRPLSHALVKRHRFPKLAHFLVEIGEGLGTAKSFRGMAVALAYSVGPVLAPSLAYGVALQLLGVQGGVWAGPVMLAAIALGQSVPVPVGMGVYYFVTSSTARSFGATPAQAAAYAALTHLATVLTQIIMGGISIWVRKLKWSELRRRKDAALAEEEQLAHEPLEA